MSTHFVFTPTMLIGKSVEHLVELLAPFPQKHFLHPMALKAFKALQKSAVKNRFNLQPASSFRDFYRQQTIWNDKFYGRRKVHDDQGKTRDLSNLSDWEKCQAILRWSALPGGSRHHWGTEIDVFDPTLLPTHQSLQLEPWEYEKGGYFFELFCWLKENAPVFDFSFPFLSLPAHCLIGREPWHISYLPLAQKAAYQFNGEMLHNAWKNENIAGKNTLLRHLNSILYHYFVNEADNDR